MGAVIVEASKGMSSFGVKLRSLIVTNGDFATRLFPILLAGVRRTCFILSPYLFHFIIHHIRAERLARIKEIDQ